MMANRSPMPFFHYFTYADPDFYVPVYFDENVFEFHFSHLMERHSAGFHFFHCTSDPKPDNYTRRCIFCRKTMHVNLASLHSADLKKKYNFNFPLAYTNLLISFLLIRKLNPPYLFTIQITIHSEICIQTFENIQKPLKEFPRPSFVLPKKNKVIHAPTSSAVFHKVFTLKFTNNPSFFIFGEHQFVRFL